LDRARRPTVRHGSQLDQEKQKAGGKRASDGGNIDDGTGGIRSVAAVYDRRTINGSDFKIDMREFLEFVIRQLVEYPDEMMLSEIPSGKMTIFKVQLRQSDVGRVIGRNGQTIHAIRALLASSAARHGQRATLEIVE
jgi:predicted RNA-binding protein YlqC (UPF0109 family)